MSGTSCIHETAVVQAVLHRQWPDGCDAELQQHAAQCEVCREVVEVAALLREDFVETRQMIDRRDVPLPSAGQIWWRAAVRARAEAARAATRPLVWGYGVAGACAVGLTIAAITMFWPALVPLFDRLGAYTAKLTPAADMIVAMLRAQLPIVIGVAACLVAMPVALYFALRED